MYKWPTKTFTGGRKYIPSPSLVYHLYLHVIIMDGWASHYTYNVQMTLTLQTNIKQINKLSLSLSLSKSSKSSNSPPKLSDYYIIHPLLNWVRTLPQFVWNQFQHLTEFCQFNKGSLSSVYLQQRSRAISYITGKILWNKSAKSDSKIAATHWTKSQSSAINQRAKWMI